jgi:hypothetical protein
MSDTRKLVAILVADVYALRDRGTDWPDRAQRRLAARAAHRVSRRPSTES